MKFYLPSVKCTKKEPSPESTWTVILTHLVCTRANAPQKRHVASLEAQTAAAAKFSDFLATTRSVPYSINSNRNGFSPGIIIHLVRWNEQRHKIRIPEKPSDWTCGVIVHCDVLLKMMQAFLNETHVWRKPWLRILSAPAIEWVYHFHRESLRVGIGHVCVSGAQKSPPPATFCAFKCAFKRYHSRDWEK